jgi:hypothetical protein
MQINDQFQASAAMSFVVISAAINPDPFKHANKRMCERYKSLHCLSSDSGITDLGGP